MLHLYIFMKHGAIINLSITINMYYFFLNYNLLWMLTNSPWAVISSHFYSDWVYTCTWMRLYIQVHARQYVLIVTTHTVLVTKDNGNPENINVSNYCTHDVNITVNWFFKKLSVILGIVYKNIYFLELEVNFLWGIILKSELIKCYYWKILSVKYFCYSFGVVLFIYLAMHILCSTTDKCVTVLSSSYLGWIKKSKMVSHIHM